MATLSAQEWIRMRTRRKNSQPTSGESTRPWYPGAEASTRRPAGPCVAAPRLTLEADNGPAGQSEDRLPGQARLPWHRMSATAQRIRRSDWPPCRRPDDADVAVIRVPGSATTTRNRGRPSRPPHHSRPGPDPLSHNPAPASSVRPGCAACAHSDPEPVPPSRRHPRRSRSTREQLRPSHGAKAPRGRPTPACPAGRDPCLGSA